MSTPKIIRITTKEIIITNIREDREGANYWIFENPFEIKSFLNPSNGELSSTLVDWLQFSCDDETRISLNDIISCNDPDGSVLDHYISIINRKKHDSSLGLEKNEIANEPEVTFEDYMEILNTNKVYH